MANPTNLVSGEVSEDKINEILATLDRWQQELQFLVALSVEQRSELAYPGDKGLDASLAMADTASRHSANFPKVVADPDEIRRDITLAKRLKPVTLRLTALAKAFEDTELAARADAYRGGLKLYGVAKQLVDAVPGLEQEISPLRDRLDRASRKKLG